MSEIIVSDTSCLILLDKIDLLYILEELFGTVTVTPEIQQEFGRKLPAWIKVNPVQNEGYQTILHTTIGLREASAIALAVEKQNCMLILDDFKARKTATRLKIKHIGTLGLLMAAKEAGIIPLMKPILEQIKKTNFRIAESLEMEILRLAGE